jgi:hypothetical protein
MKPNLKPKTSNNMPSIGRRLFNKTAIENFKTFLLDIEWSTMFSVGSGVDSNINYNTFLNKFLAGFDTFFPKQISKCYNKTARKEWMTAGLVKSCEHKSKLYKRFKEAKTTEAKQLFTAYRNKLKSLLVKAERDFYSSKIINCQNDCKKSWQIINRLLNKRVQMSVPSTEFYLNKRLLTDKQLVVENFNDYFVNIGKSLAEKIPEPKKEFVNYIKPNPTLMDSCAMHLTSSAEIIDIVNQMKNSESSGVDEVTITVIKSVIRYIAEPLSLIFNQCLCEGTFPEKMKTAKVCPVYKSGSKNEFTNYRPISILNSFSKILEKIIAIRLISYLDKHDILDSSQYGFRKKHSTYMAMMCLYDKVSEAIDRNEFCVGIFIDLSKAFDTLDHSILLKKLEMYGIRGKANLLIKSYLTNRQQYVFYNEAKSSLKPINFGVPQGSILGPLLFILYINDMASCSKYLYSLLFADDTNIIYSNSDIWKLMEIVSLELETLSDWFKANRLSLNVKKTNFMLFGYRKIPQCCDNIPREFYLRINNERILIKLNSLNL